MRGMGGGTSLVLAVLGLLFGAPPVAATSSIVISQFRTQGVASGDFVELLNVSNAPVTLPASGWSLFNLRSDDMLQCTIVNPNSAPSITLQPGQHYLFGDSATGTGNATPDATLTTYVGTGLPCSGLFDAAGVLLLNGQPDQVGWGTLTNGAATSEPPAIVSVPSNGDSLRRKQNGRQDTDNNNSDFQIVTADPLNSSFTDPTASTDAATGVGLTGATMNGTVDPNGATITDCHFDYGTTTSYGTSIACASTPSGSSPIPVSAPASGLSAATPYHFRLVVTSAAGVLQGSDAMFTTLAQNTTTTTTMNTTSTTLPGDCSTLTGFAAVDCQCRAGLHPATCATETLPKAFATLFTHACMLGERANTSPAKKAKRLDKNAARTFRRVSTLAGKAGKKRKHGITPDCASALQQAVAAGTHLAGM